MTAEPVALLPTIAVVGSGPSAIYTLKHLVEDRCIGRVVMFEAGDRPGVGTPYDARHNPPVMLANIASIELPRVHDTLLGWLASLDPDQRTRLGISPEHLHERHFFPRMVLGEYFEAGLAQLIDAARGAGIRVELRAHSPVLDLVSSGGRVEVMYRSGGATLSEAFDFVVLATGHAAPRPRGGNSRMADPYRRRSETSAARRLGIIGSSLSAIDAAVSHALGFGAFQRIDDRLEFVAAPGEEHRTIAMMSRSGLLPEADFFCPIPYEPLDVFTQDAVDQAVAHSAGALDRLFALFAKQLAAADPAYAAETDLATANADTFAERYFAARAGTDPFAWAEENLREVRSNAAHRKTVPWRYAILRMHEPFGAALAQLDEGDVARFNAGLKRVFIDNYAAVPPLSIERILALHRAGILDLVRLGKDYDTRCEDDGSWSVDNGQTAWRFDQLVDARGQSALGQDDFPFPTLRLQIRASALLNGDDDDAVPLAEANALADGADPLARVFCLSLPFVMQRNPFVQGLTAANEMGEEVARAISGIVRNTANTQEAEEEIARLLGTIDDSTTLLCGTEDGLVPISVPRSGKG